MTSLRENIKKSLDDNLKKRDDVATATLRLILAAIKDSDIENRTKKKGDTISDQQILLLLQNMVKQRKESVDIYSKAGRIDLKKREEKEIEIINVNYPLSKESFVQIDKRKNKIEITKNITRLFKKETVLNGEISTSLYKAAIDAVAEVGIE